MISAGFRRERDEKCGCCGRRVVARQPQHKSHHGAVYGHFWGVWLMWLRKIRVRKKIFLSERDSRKKILCPSKKIILGLILQPHNHITPLVVSEGALPLSLSCGYGVTTSQPHATTKRREVAL